MKNRDNDSTIAIIEGEALENVDKLLDIPLPLDLSRRSKRVRRNNSMLTGKVINCDALTGMRQIPAGTVDLVYLDPPFFSKRDYHTKCLFDTYTGFTDKWQDGLEGYIAYMTSLIRECHRVLSKTGSIYIHCDWHASHYLKVQSDSIFGYSNFRNEIVWKRHNAHNDTAQGGKLFGRVHDVILFYSKSKTYTWNPIFQKYSDDYVKRYYRHVETGTGRRYAHGDLSGPGGPTKGNPYYEFLGFRRYWRYGKQRMANLYAQGRIIQKKKGTLPKLKRYLDEMPGIVLQDVWNDIMSVQVTRKESVGYPTQKPVQLLERIVEVSSNPNDVVLDPMCGSGTALVSARNLGRKWIGIDSNSIACRIAANRLEASNVVANIVSKF